VRQTQDSRRRNNEDHLVTRSATPAHRGAARSHAARLEIAGRMLLSLLHDPAAESRARRAMAFIA